MKYLVIEPHDSVIIRDGRPFSTVAGVAKAHSLPFVTPSVIAGALRGRIATNNYGAFSGTQNDVAVLQAVSIQGYTLVKRSTTEGQVARWEPYFVRPADALSFKDSHRWYRVTPQPLHAAKTDLSEHDLVPLQLPDDAPVGKIADRAPFWSVSMIQQWMMGAQLTIGDTGINEIEALPRDGRYHVKIDSASGAAEEGKLFATDAIGFRTAKSLTVSQYAILLFVDDQQTVQLSNETNASSIADRLQVPPAVDTLGGEQRIVQWHDVAQSHVVAATYFDAPPHDLVQSVVQTRTCRVLLMTPGYIEDLVNPQQLIHSNVNITVRVESVALPRAEWYSGWDMLNNQPKSARRFVPAGTVFFLRLECHDANPDVINHEINQWIKDKWMTSISDDVTSEGSQAAQMRRDGSGFVIIGCGW